MSRHRVDGAEPDEDEGVAVAVVEAVAVTAVTAGVFTKRDPTVGREPGEGSSGGGWSWLYDM